MAKAPKVKRYKASVEGYRYGERYEAEVVTYATTRKETLDTLKNLISEEGELYMGTYKTKKVGRASMGVPARVNITPMRKVEQEYRVLRRDVIKPYTRIVKGKKQQVSGYTREYREYYIPEPEVSYEMVEGKPLS